MNLHKPNKLEFHYFFDDNSHTIDAIVRHKCETELLALIQEVALQLKIEIRIELETPIDGGFIDKYKIDALKVSILGLGIGSLSLIFTGINTVLSRYPVSSSNQELEKLNIEIAKKTLEKINKENEENASNI